MKKTNNQKSKMRVTAFFMMILQLVHNYGFAQSSNCIDLSNPYASFITGTYGTFYNPYQYTGIVSGRHTVITRQGTDPRTNGGLYMIPPGESYSFKLGNENVGAEAESIIIEILVDTSNFNLLILKYAAVMEDPNHIPSHQPRFKFDILNTQNQPINPDCLSADFVANASLGWHDNNGVLWKDWTNVGVDISEFHGQTIRVRLTTFDCEESGHFGYAYFLLSCANKLISIEDCGDADDYTYSAPDGFAYKWFWEDNPSQIISDRQSVSVSASENRTLQCHVSFIENPNCGFDLYSNVHYRYPLSDFSVQATDYPQKFQFLNQSSISNDGINPDGTGVPCGNAFWNFGDGQISYSFSPEHTYAHPGEYTVMMVAGLNNFSCTDTTYHSLIVLAYNEFDALSCEEYEWNNITYTRSGDYTQVFPTSHMYDSLVVLHLTIVHDEMCEIEDKGCEEYEWHGNTYTYSGVYYEHYVSHWGCDSIVALNLMVEYEPLFHIVGTHFPIAGTEEAYTKYEYRIEMDNPLSSVDSVHWSMSYTNGFELIPFDGGLKAHLVLYAYSLDTIEIKAVAYNRCGLGENTTWYRTTYFDVEDNQVMNDFEIYPNPNKGVCNLSFYHAMEAFAIQIFDSYGREVLQRNYYCNSAINAISLDLSKFPDGLYFIILNHEGKRTIRKCLINK